MKDTKTGYSVNDGYFDELKARIMTAVEDEQNTQPAPVVTWRVAFKRMAGFAAGFILLVAITSTVYYFAAGKTQQNETELATQDIVLLYDIDEDDILDIEDSFESNVSSETALAYVELYGYPSE